MSTRNPVADASPRSDPRELARRALAFADDRPTQVTVTRGSSHLCRVSRADDAPSLTQESAELQVLVLHDGRQGRASATDLTDAALADAVARAATTASHAARDGPGDGHPGLPGPQAPRAHAGFHPATARHDPETTRAVLAVLRASVPLPLELDGAWTTRSRETAIASSTGLELHDRSSRALLELWLRDPATGRRVTARAAAVRAADLDAAAVASRALIALAAGALTTLSAGPLLAVLSPEAVAAGLTQLGCTAFNGLAHAEGRGPLTGRLGSRVAASAVNLSDSPRFPGTLPAAFDQDGIPKAPIPLIQDGVAHRVVHDLRSAARAGGAAASTGHATAPGGAPDGPQPEHLVLIGGGAADVAELCAPIERGLYVADLAYGDEGSAAMGSGLVRIEGGRLAGPVADARLAADPLELLRGTQALTGTQWLIPAGDRASVVAPALRTSGMAVH